MLCSSFRFLAKSTWNKLRISKAVDFKFNEETITEENLFHLKLKHPFAVRIKTFNKHEESINGADWEWWFVEGASQGIGFRVQAKIIDLPSESYRYLHKTGQTTKLINDAKRKNGNPAKVPIYCLYTFVEDGASGESNFGCSIIDAYKVDEVNPLCKYTELHWYLKPWEVLVCNEDGRGRTLKDIDDFIQKYYPGAIAAKLDLDPPSRISDVADADRTMITQELPSYVKNILNEENTAKTPDKGLSGIIVIDIGKN